MKLPLPPQKASKLSPSPSERLAGVYRVGNKLDDEELYELVEVLEYKGQPTPRPLVQKQIRAEFCGNSAVRERLAAVRERLIGMQHANLVEVVDVQIGDPDCWLITERVEGKSLMAILQERGRLSLTETREICQKVGAVLQFAHDRGIYHGDLRPGNILIHRGTEPPKVKVTDFMLARPLTDSLLGTPSYVAPELLQPGPPRSPTPRSDLYALAAVAYEMLFHQRAFPVETLAERMRLLSADPHHHVLTGEDAPRTTRVTKVLFSALDEVPENRPASVAAFITALDEAARPVLPPVSAAAVAKYVMPNLTAPELANLDEASSVLLVQLPTPPQLAPSLGAANKPPEALPPPMPWLPALTSIIMLGLVISVVQYCTGKRPATPDMAAPPDAALPPPPPPPPPVYDLAATRLPAGPDGGKRVAPDPPPPPPPPKRLICAFKDGIDKKLNGQDFAALRGCLGAKPAALTARVYDLHFKKIPNVPDLVLALSSVNADAFRKDDKFMGCLKKIKLQGDLLPQGVHYVCEYRGLPATSR